MEINKFIQTLNNSWCKESAYKTEAENWSENNKSKGQCAITALLAQDYFGGKIKYGNVISKNYTHYWNEINEKKIDFTKEQFDKDVIIEEIGFKSREKLLENEDTKKRYKILRKRAENFIEKASEIEQNINACNKCNIEHVIGDNIYFGKNSKFLFVGEAPAKNGWRITGKAWINEKNKIIPSGKILQKLLTEINIDLFDISFVEIIKCFPPDRKQLNEYASNCLPFFHKQIELINPKVIVTLGEVPTRLLLHNIKFKKLSDIVGKEVEYHKNSNIKIVPIYHPSPISPKSLKGNIPIFQKILNKYK